MPAIEKLLRLHKVEQQLRGLRSRIDSAQRYLDAQSAQLADLNTRHEALLGQVRQLEATSHNQETELGAIDDRIAKLREQLNSAKTNKEYSAFLTEMSTLKDDRSAVETQALEAMGQIDDLKAGVEEINEQIAERTKICEIAKAQRDEREQEVKDRLDELQVERDDAAKDVPGDLIAIYEHLATQDVEDAMAPLEEHSRRSMEYACGSCQMMMPMEVISVVLGKGAPTQCVNCGAFLYMEEQLRESMMASKK